MGARCHRAVAGALGKLKPRLAVVVLCYRASKDVAGAVRSILEQDEESEIVVVNSGGGDIRQVLREAGIDVPCAEYQERLYAGAARNRGIALTSAPFVAFLAHDCRACPRWTGGRLARHGAGIAAVASAMVNSQPASLVASAAHIAMFMRRLPGLPENRAIRFGVSFDRRLFSEFGLFDEALRTGEDTDYLRRLPLALEPAWAPDIRTVHLNETRFTALMGDLFRRGVRYGRNNRRLLGRSPWRTSRSIMRQMKWLPVFAWRGLDGAERNRTMAAMPIAWAALAAMAAGTMLCGWCSGDAAPAEVAA
jgi:glycosyltransferase involved in cell wall biosynthesis